jgi:hypothetical protein
MNENEITKSLLLFEISGKLSVAIDTLNDIRRDLLRRKQIYKDFQDELRFSEFDMAFLQIVEIYKKLSDEQLVFIKEINKACNNY